MALLFTGLLGFGFARQRRQQLVWVLAAIGRAGESH